MKTILIVLSWVIISLGGSIFWTRYYYPEKLHAEYERGMMDGAGYYQRHGQYPSYWHWNHAMNDPDFNIDTVLAPPNVDLLRYDFKRHVDSIMLKGSKACTWPDSVRLTDTVILPTVSSLESGSYFIEYIPRNYVEPVSQLPLAIVAVLMALVIIGGIYSVLEIFINRKVK